MVIIYKKIFTSIFLIFLLSSCSNSENNILEGGAEDFYQRGIDAMSDGNYPNSLAYFQALEANYPFSNLTRQNSFLNFYALEIDKKPLEFSIRNELFQNLWDPKVLKILKSLSQNCEYKDQFFKCNILWGDARETVNNIPDDIKFDLIYLDGFSPQKCPQIWSVEFLEKVTQRLNTNGYLITYSSSAAIRKTLRNFGFYIFNIKPNLVSKNLWSNGTIAIKIIKEEYLQSYLYFEKLSLMEEEHLLTKASIPYRDPNLNSNANDIIQKRVQEQLLSNLKSSKEWREKWGMTK